MAFVSRNFWIWPWAFLSFGLAAGEGGDGAVLPPLVILPMGDSITQGGLEDRDEYTYRYPLQQMLYQRGIAFEMVGTRRDGLHAGAMWPEIAPGVPFDLDHAGYYGWKTRAVVDKVIAEWDKLTATPDIVLIHLGTNDQKYPPHDVAVQAPLREFIGFLREKNPQVVILLGHLNFRDSEGAKSIRPLVQALAEEASTEASPVIAVHHYRDWVADPEADDTDTFDWAHPNPQGQRKMAEAWMAALEPHLPRF